MYRRGLRLPLLAAWAVVVVLLLLRWADAANWAQVSGSTRHSNTAVLPTTSWTRRHGHAVTALDFSDAYTASTGKKARLFVLGGDSNVQGSQDLRAYPGGGSFKNDVWATTGIKWQVESSLLKQNKWGDQLAQLVANITWLQTNSGKMPPRGVTYDEWIACAAAAWAVNPPTGCDDPSKPPGAYLADSMFSPRRNFAAVAFQNELLVLGGRAREHVPVPELDLRGGVSASELTSIRSEIGPRNARLREYAVLKNDVWRSSDAGASWSLVNIGCKFPQRELVRKAGRKEFQCETSDDCEGDASCVFDEAYSTGFCVCNVWSPREFHAVAVHNGKLFVSGGYAMVERGNCGVEEHARKRASGDEFACGGGYREYMSDVWVSSDGAGWKQLTSSARLWFSPRGEHTMVSFRSILYVLGGRTGTGESPSSVNGPSTLLNDVWASGSDGETWYKVTDAAPWSPRAQHVALVAPKNSSSSGSSVTGIDKLLVMFGEDEERPLDDVWAWNWPDSSDSGNWVRDFGLGADTQGYVTPDSSVRMLRIVTRDDADALERAGIATIRDLSALTFDQIVPLRFLPTASVALPLPSVDSILTSILAASLQPKGMPVCDYMALAKLVVEQCTVAADLDQAALLALATKTEGEADATATEWDGCAHFGDQATNAGTGRKYWPDVNGIDQVQTLRDVFVDAQETTCRWQPSARAGHAGAVFKGRVFVLGGLVTAPDYFDNDVWYRDDVLPMAQFSLVPRDGSSETEFAFASEEAGCVFEYEVLNTVEMLVVRNWTRVALSSSSSTSTTSATTGSEGTMDVISWLDGGTFRVRIRAVDPAGNVDASFELGRNEYEWTYVPALPWGLIIGGSVVAVVLLAGFLMEWRKRRKRAAMERYAMKRMRRKLRSKQATGKDGKKSKKKGKKKADDTDGKWRETYDKAKDKKPVGDKKKTKKTADGDEKKEKKKKKKDGAERRATKAKATDAKDKKKTKKKKKDDKVKPAKDKNDKKKTKKAADNEDKASASKKKKKKKTK